jgi:hypothetical protein
VEHVVQPADGAVLSRAPRLPAQNFDDYAIFSEPVLGSRAWMNRRKDHFDPVTEKLRFAAKGSARTFFKTSVPTAYCHLPSPATELAA